VRSYCQGTGISVTLGDVTSQPLAELVGGNCKRLRTKIGITQDELARHARDLGLRWNAAKVGDFEAGRSAPTFATVIAVTLALQKALNAAADRRDGGPGWAVMLPDLVEGRTDEFVALTEALEVSAKLIEDVCRGQVPEGYKQKRPRLRPFPASAATALVDGSASSILQRSGLTEDRLAHRLNMSRQALAAMSHVLWQKTFSEERDLRAGRDANRQKRGRVTRTLQTEIESKLADTEKKLARGND
jgi:transcriptional regulator with XRE-family HTH domain